MTAKQTEPVTIVSLRELNLATPEPRPRGKGTTEVSGPQVTAEFPLFSVFTIFIATNWFSNVLQSE